MNNYLLALVKPDLLGVDGHIDLGLGPFKLQGAALLAVAAGAEAWAAKNQLLLHPLLQGAAPLAPVD